MDYDVIIIGGGPAGLTAAIYTARARLKTLLLESFSVPGQAVITDHLENYPGFPDGINGFELIEKFKKQAENFGAELKVGNVERIEKDKEREVTQQLNDSKSDLRDKYKLTKEQVNEVYEKALKRVEETGETITLETTYLAFFKESMQPKPIIRIGPSKKKGVEGKKIDTSKITDISKIPPTGRKLFK